MNNEDYTINCSRCGAPMKASARYCMRCGNLNPNHPDNKNMQKYIPKSQGYMIKNGQTMAVTLDSNGNIIKDQEEKSNIGNDKLAFIITYGIYLISIIILILTTHVTSFQYFISTKTPYFLLCVAIISLYIFAQERIFIKMNQKWWKALIPIYNLFILSERVMGKAVFGIFCLIPGVNVIYIFILLYNMGKRFEKNGIITMLFFPIMSLVIGLDDSLYDNKTFIPKEHLERNYKFKKAFLTTTIVILVFSLVCIILANISNIKTISIDDREYYLKVAEKMTKKFKSDITSPTSNIDCNGETYYGEDGTYYFYYTNMGKVSGTPFNEQHEVISGYIKMVVANGNKSYYLTMSDGKKGFPEVGFDSITKDTITNYTKLNDINGNSCTID